MDLWLLFLFVMSVVVVAKDKGMVASDDHNEVSFEEHYEVMFGNDHVVADNQGSEVQLSMDNSSGSGFGSKMTYGSGFFKMRIKVPHGDTSGVVTAYYLSSHGDYHHDEIDYEFLGNKEGKAHTLQTNIYVDGEGAREQRLHLWFDPSLDFHNYSILFNQHQIIFFVDRIPIRVYKNKSDIGAGFPTKAMRIEATLWDGDDWATNGGKTTVNWSYAPFKASFRDFGVNGCEVQALSSSSTPQDCFSDRFSWNRQEFWQLDPARQRLYENVQKTYVTYDYCADKPRFSYSLPKEC